ncbi:PH domain-containing protein DDB_G0274775-like [Ylistrum balloti]|uniref:PH domain-containing protein DDB_G0274775-like n=1 Tax=Ylistrum balloti TaxID=509963 RepID=UPI002905909D|nr:PH domain-containing protein DDB_G0274775-like [Ylistrum balloti]
MASSESSDSRTNSLNTTSSHNDDSVTHIEMKGWLMKRSKMSKKWKKQWFLLKNTELAYGDTPEQTSKRIPLTNSEISETNIDKKNYAFRIKSKDIKRTFYIHADNENIQNEWMQAICFAKAAGRHGDMSQACVVQ